VPLAKPHRVNRRRARQVWSAPRRPFVRADDANHFVVAGSPNCLASAFGLERCFEEADIRALDHPLLWLAMLPGLRCLRLRALPSQSTALFHDTTRADDRWPPRVTEDSPDAGDGHRPQQAPLSLLELVRMVTGAARWTERAMASSYAAGAAASLAELWQRFGERPEVEAARGPNALRLEREWVQATAMSAAWSSGWRSYEYAREGSKRVSSGGSNRVRAHAAFMCGRCCGGGLAQRLLRSSWA